MQPSTRALTIMDAVFPRASLLRDAALVMGFALLTAVSAQIAIYLPFTPVPISGQTLAVLLCGALLGSRRGALSQLAYIAAGAAGLPYVWTPVGPPGLARIVAYPSGGYIIGFVVAAFVIGFLAERGWDRRWVTMALAMLIGDGLILLFGVYRMTHFFPLEVVLVKAVYPYIPGDLVKIALATVALPSGWHLLRRWG